MNVKTLKSNKFYRISDLFFGWGNRWEQDREYIISNPDFKNTILFKYLTQKKEELDYGLFKQIVRKQTSLNKYETPSINELVVQIRLGDVMDSLDYNHSRNKSIIFYSDFFKYINLDLKKIKKITAVTALHFGSNEFNGRYFYSEKAEEESMKIIESLSKQCSQKGYDLNIYSHEDIDRDICYLANSMYFVKGITQLGDLITKCLPNSCEIFEPFSYF